jgi:hypothetical protein
MSEFQMELALLELNQVRKHLCRQHVALSNQLRQPSQELRIPQSHQLILVAHHACLSCVISVRALALRNRFLGTNAFEVDRGQETLA